VLATALCYFGVCVFVSILAPVLYITNCMKVLWEHPHGQWPPCLTAALSPLRSRNGPFHATSAEPASRHPAPEHLFSDGPAAQGTMGEVAAQSSRQLGSTGGELAYAAVVAGRTGPQQPHGPRKSPAKGSDHTVPAASSEVATRHMSLASVWHA